MLIHSYAYYALDRSMVSDDTWQRWADELATLQLVEDGAIGFYDAEFADWTGNTGMHLPRDPWVVGKTHDVLALHYASADLI